MRALPEVAFRTKSFPENFPWSRDSSHIMFESCHVLAVPMFVPPFLQSQFDWNPPTTFHPWIPWGQFGKVQGYQSHALISFPSTRGWRLFLKMSLGVKLLCFALTIDWSIMHYYIWFLLFYRQLPFEAQKYILTLASVKITFDIWWQANPCNAASSNACASTQPCLLVHKIREVCN